MPVLAIWAGTAVALAIPARRVVDWFWMTDELLYERLAFSVARTGSPLPVLHGQRVAYLEVDAAEAARRVGLNTARPLLLGNVRGQLSQLLNQRKPLYEQVATITVSTVGRDAGEVAALIVKELPA